MADEAVGACWQISAESAEGLVTGPSSVRREEEHVDDVEDVEVEEEEEAVALEMVEVDKVRFSLLLWLSRGQKRLGVRCNSPQTLPKCPVVVTRETSCALSWPARTAVGAVGRSGAS